MGFLKNERKISFDESENLEFYSAQKQYDKLMSQFLANQEYEKAAALKKEGIEKGLITKPINLKKKRPF